MLSSGKMKGLSIIIAILGWLGLGYLVTNFHPTTLTLSFFFLLLFLTLTATFFPVASYLNRRFASKEDDLRPLRQSCWAALFIVLCAWLQMIRTLNWLLALLLFCVFCLLEAFIITQG
jgi:hypothetical protein